MFTAEREKEVPDSSGCQDRDSNPNATLGGSGPLYSADSPPGKARPVAAKAALLAGPDFGPGPRAAPITSRRGPR